MKLSPITVRVAWHIMHIEISFCIDNTTIPLRVSNIYLLRFKIGCYRIPDQRLWSLFEILPQFEIIKLGIRRATYQQ